MENKVFVKIILPELDISYDVFLPVNSLIWVIKKLLVKALSDVTGIMLNQNGSYILINKDTGKIYKNNEIVIDTDIRNTTELLLVSLKN